MCTEPHEFERKNIRKELSCTNHCQICECDHTTAASDRGPQQHSQTTEGISKWCRLLGKNTVCDEQAASNCGNGGSACEVYSVDCRKPGNHSQKKANETGVEGRITAEYNVRYQQYTQPHGKNTASHPPVYNG